MAFNWINSLEGLGRVPVDAGENVLVITFERFTRQYKNIMINKDTGKQIWSKSLPCGGYSSPVIVNDVIFTPTAYTKLAGLERKTGNHLWTIDFGARNRSTPTPLAESIITTNTNTVYKINQKGKIEQKETIAGSFLYGNGKADENYFYCVGDENNSNSEARQFIYAVNISDLSFSWKVETGAGLVPSSDTAGIEVDNLYLYTTDLNGKITCVSKEEREVVWSTNVEVVTARHQPIVHKEKLFVTAMSGEIFCLNKHNGEIIFKNKYDGEIDSPVGIYNDNILVHAGNFLYYIDQTGKTLSTYPIGHGPYSAITVLDKDVFVTAGDPPDWSHLVSLNPQKEEELSIKLLNKEYELSETSNEKDNLIVDFEIFDNSNNKITTSMTVDFRSLGGGEYDKVSPDKNGVYSFQISAPQKCRYGEYSLPVKTNKNSELKLGFLYLDLRIENRNLPSKYINEDFNIVTQHSPDKSGPATMQAIFQYQGKEVNQDEIDRMTQFYKEINLDQHHYWRTGATRIFNASNGPLYERKNANPKLQDLFEE